MGIVLSSDFQTGRGGGGGVWCAVLERTIAQFYNLPPHTLFPLLDWDGHYCVPPSPFACSACPIQMERQAGDRWADLVALHATPLYLPHPHL